MMKVLFLFLVVLCFSAECFSQAEDMPADIVLAEKAIPVENVMEWDPGEVKLVEEQLPDGKITRSYKGEKLHGATKIYYADGTLKSLVYYFEEQFHGPTKRFYPNGQLQEERYYQFGKDQGAIKQYTQEGALKGEWHYKEGQYHGVVREFFHSGSLKAEWNYKDGKRHGPVEKYFDNGQKDGHWDYKEGVYHGRVEKYYPQGQLLSRCFVKEGKPEGGCEVFYPTGKPKMSLSFVNGVVNGKVLAYYPDGQVMLESGFKDGLLNGWFKTFDTKGKVLISDQFLENKILDEKGVPKNGSHKMYDFDGKSVMEYQLKDGIPFGAYKSFDENGQVVHEGYINEDDREALLAAYKPSFNFPSADDNQGDQSGDEIPVVIKDKATREDYKLNYIARSNNKAFAYSDDGPYGWCYGKDAEEDAKQCALDYCNNYREPGQAACKIISLNGKITGTH